ncbi:MAG: AsnC family transcriptional regulator [Methylococcales bacterium]|nr:AsnC family transcriptional regulator [Methylococcales bacterium]
MDKIDRQIITATQAGLPLTPQPYQTIADQLGISAEIVMQRLSSMQKQKIIRRIGVVPNHYRLGYNFNGMTVWNIADEHIDKMGKKVGQLDFVSHCYHRPRHEPEWHYNLFAMVHSKTETGVKQQISAIAELLGDYNLGHNVLYSTRILKKTGLRIDSKNV